MSNPRASIEGLAGERYWGSFWLALGLILLWLDQPGAVVIVGGILLGGMVAVARIKAFSAGKLQLGDRVVLVQMAILLIGVFSLPKSQVPRSAWGFLGVGAFVSGISKLITGLCEGRINRALDATFFGETGIFAELGKVEPEVAWGKLPSMAPHPVWEQLRQSLAPSLWLDACKSDSEREGHPISKLGGTPDLPGDFEWPVFHGERLDFLGQIRLDEVAAINSSLGLPETGLLSFFYSAEQPWGHEETDMGGCRVYIHPLKTVGPSVHGKAQEVVPLQFANFDSPGINDATRSILWGLEEVVPKTDRREFSHLLSSITPEEDRHQLLGHPVLIQNDMEDELGTVARLFGLPKDTRWTLLLQLWSEPRLEWCWGDAGSLYFWIPTEDLACQRFDRAWVILQCT